MTGHTQGHGDNLGAAELWHVDSFAPTRFSGNPAAVVVLEAAPDDLLVEALGGEFNLPATAVVWPKPTTRSAIGDPISRRRFCLRWRTASAELPLCGHGTLAAGHVLYSSGRVAGDVPIEFETVGGQLTARLAGDQIVLDFPAMAPRPIETPDELGAALGERGRSAVRSVHRSDLDLLVELSDEDAVIGAQPDLQQLLRIDVRGLILTARAGRSRDHDFVSRFFSPATGLPEDSVTGSAHCTLAPFWLKRLGVESLLGYQASQRGGYVQVAMPAPDRVELAGVAITISRGLLTLD